MVRYVITLMGLVLSLSAHAQEPQKVNVEFNSVTISELSQLFVKGLLKRDYIISETVLSDARKVSMSVKGVDENKLLPFLKNYLISKGISLSDRGGIVYLDQAKIEVKDFVVSENYPGKDFPQNAEQAAEDVYAYDLKSLSVLELLPIFKAYGVEPIYAEGGVNVLFKASEGKYKKLSEALAKTDTRSQQVLIDAYIYEFSKSDAEASAFNVALNLINSKLSLNLGSKTLSNFVSTTGDLKAVLSVLDTDSRFSVVSNPKLRGTHNKVARFVVGSETPILGAVTTGNGQTTQSVTYRPSGVIFEVRPQIYSDQVIVDLSQQLSSFVLTTTGVNDSPTLIKRELNTTVSVSDGEIVLMGGLAEDKDANEKSGWFVLPPILNAKSKSKTATDIFLILKVTRL